VNRLLDYLPPVLQSIAEFKAINKGCTPPLQTAWEDTDTLLDDQFIDTATEQSVSVWESEFGITPDVSDTLTVRKTRLKSVWTKSVYTMQWLQGWIAANCGNDTDAPSVSDYLLSVTFPVQADYLNLIRVLKNRIPANILLCPILLGREKELYYHTIYPQSHITCSIQTDIADIPVDTPTDNAGNMVSDNNGDLIITGGTT